ncbi:MAG: hypothetical protein IH622_03645 [Ochrobactrum anthropi]|uniref:Uncharacterized protein n=1 Tax=Brucella anthropi TaxID=529 RepID=A0A8I0N394_BRUAN|nr:hypothetical protein [Brucella anthropi]MBE0559913.1 hypothetical protein [Brucella anthropi]
MDGFELIASLVESATKIAWPAAAFACVWIMRDDLRKLLPRAYFKHGEFEAGFYTGQESVVEQVIDHNVTVNAQPLAVRNLQDFSNAELRDLATDTTTRMRNFERSIKQERNHRFGFDNILYYDSSRNDYTERLLKQSNENLHRWRSDYQPDAVAIRDELLRRLGPNHDVDLHRARVALDHGMLAGPSPIADAATAIEMLCHALPD